MTRRRLWAARVLVVVIGTAGCVHGSSRPIAKGSIVFTGVHTRRDHGLYIVSARGGHLKKLVSAIAAFPAWSPDGKRIAFSRFHGDRFEIDVVNADGRERRRVVVAGPEALFAGNHPTWSPDGKRIAFSSDKDGVQQLYVVNADGTNLGQLTHDVGGSVEPSWSPDGHQIAFAGAANGRSEQIYVVRPDGSGRHSLSRNAFGHAAAPAWSPTGRKIAFWGDWSGKENIYVMNADGSDQRRVTDDAVGADGPTWSPDGTKIVFASRRSGNFQLYVIDADGTHLEQLTRDRGLFATQPSWGSGG